MIGRYVEEYIDFVYTNTSRHIELNTLSNRLPLPSSPCRTDADPHQGPPVLRNSETDTKCRSHVTAMPIR
jgi:hypothetical protein